MKAFRSPNGWAVELLEAEAAIKSAVLAEREACAKLAENWDFNVQGLVKAIRARSDK